MDADASQQQEAAVQVGVKQEKYPFAEQLSKRPRVLQDVVDEQGQREEAEQVCHSQVHQVDSGAGPVLGVGAARPQCGSLEEQPQHHEDGAVSGGNKMCLEPSTRRHKAFPEGLFSISFSPSIAGCSFRHHAPLFYCFKAARNRNTNTQHSFVALVSCYLKEICKILIKARTIL